MKIVLTATPEIESQGKYSKMTVKYEANGRDSTKTIVSFGADEPAYKVLAGAAEGETYEITSVAKGKYSNWTSAVKLAGDELPPSRPRSNKYHEADEERQIRIMRQSCLSSASNFHNGKAGVENEAAVLATAQVFYQWVTQPLTDSKTTTEGGSLDEVL